MSVMDQNKTFKWNTWYSGINAFGEKVYAYFVAKHGMIPDYYTIVYIENRKKLLFTENGIILTEFKEPKEVEDEKTLYNLKSVIIRERREQRNILDVLQSVTTNYSILETLDIDENSCYHKTKKGNIIRLENNIPCYSWSYDGQHGYIKLQTDGKLTCGYSETNKNKYNVETFDEACKLIDKWRNAYFNKQTRYRDSKKGLI